MESQLWEAVLASQYFLPRGRSRISASNVAFLLIKYEEADIARVLDRMASEGIVESAGENHYRITRKGYSAREALLRMRGWRVRSLAKQKDYRLTDLVVAVLMSSEDATRIRKYAGSFWHDWPPKIPLSTLEVFLCDFTRDELEIACDSLVASGFVVRRMLSVDGTEEGGIEATTSGDRHYRAVVKVALGLGRKEFILKENHRDRIYVFYAWQSDYPRSNTVISRVLEDWADSANAKWGLVAPLVVERAQVVGEGAVRIDLALQKKIARADLFVGDITPTFQFRAKLCPNANVLVETGYALARKRAQQVLLLAQQRDKGDIPGDGAGASLPFDIDHVGRWEFTDDSDLRARFDEDVLLRFRNQGLLYEPHEGDGNSPL